MTKLLTSREVAEQLRVSESTLRNWRRAGKGPVPIRLVGSYRYTEESLQEFVDRKGKYANLDQR